MTIEQWLKKAEICFSGEMTAEEAHAFESETSASDELTALRELWKSTEAEAIAFEQHKAGADALKSTHQILKKDFISNKPRSLNGIPIWKWAAAAAILSGIIFMGKTLFRKAVKEPPVVVQHTTDTLTTAKQQPVKESKTPYPSEKDSVYLADVYAHHFTPDEAPDDQSGPLADAYFYYASGQYRKAIAAIDSADNKQVTRGGRAPESSAAPYANYYKAISLMSLGKQSAAVSLLKQLMTSDVNELKPKARWYLALAHLKLERLSSSLIELQALARDSTLPEYQQNARKLLLELSNR
jgi:tetratricopeptide (TPR) repeat protein